MSRPTVRTDKQAIRYLLQAVRPHLLSGWSVKDATLSGERYSHIGISGPEGNRLVQVSFHDFGTRDLSSRLGMQITSALRYSGLPVAVTKVIWTDLLALFEKYNQER